MDLSDMYTTMGIILSMYEERLSTRITLDYNAQALDHRLRTPSEEIAFTARPKSTPTPKFLGKVHIF